MSCKCLILMTRDRAGGGFGLEAEVDRQPFQRFCRWQRYVNASCFHFSDPIPRAATSFLTLNGHWNDCAKRRLACAWDEMLYDHRASQMSLYPHFT
jgi:hypothetical protein